MECEKQTGLMVAIGVLLFTASGCKMPEQHQPYVLFDWFRYQGKDTVFNVFIPAANEYQNPVLAGLYPDPSIGRALFKRMIILKS